MVFVWILIGILALCAIACLAVGAALMHTATARNARQRETPEEENVYAPYRDRIAAGGDWFLGQRFEEWHMVSYDGLKLRARYLAVEGARGTVVCMHGYRGDPLMDYGTLLRFYAEAGYNILLPDERSHWESEGRFITYGVRERFDCRDWVRTVNAHGGDSLPVFLHGLSMGAAIVLMTTGLALPENVRGVIADCGFTSPDAIFRHVIQTSFHLPPDPFVPAAGLFTRLFAGFSIRGCSTLDAMQTNRLPILFLHGTADDFVPFSMSEQNVAACRAEKEFVVVEGARHAQSVLVDPERCRARILAFLSAHA